MPEIPPSLHEPPIVVPEVAGVVVATGATHDPVAVRDHVAGKPSSAHDRMEIAVLGAVTAVVVPYGVHTSVAVPPAYW